MADSKLPEARLFWDATQEVRRLFHDLVHQPWGRGEHPVTSGWQPSCDMVETDSAILVALELPEGRCEDVRIAVEGAGLRISGEKRCVIRARGQHCYYRERYIGRFERWLHLPAAVDPAAIRVECVNGVLMVVLPKLGKA